MLSISVLHLLFLSASARILSSAYSDLCSSSSSYQNYGSTNGYNSNSYSSSSNDDAINRQNSWSPDYYVSYGYSLPSCDSADENAHGLYSSNLAACEISFHKSNVTIVEDSFQLLSPEASTDNNRVALSGSKAVSILQYVSNWKDECVADFTRCYSLAANQDIYRSLVCRKKWTIPTGATHMSVNCTKDMQLKQAAIIAYKNDRNNVYNNNNANDPLVAIQDKQMKADSKRWHEMEAILSTILAVLVLSCFCFSIVVYWCMVKPYMAFSSAAKRSEIEDLMTTASDSKHTISSSSRGGMHQAEIA